ncbi:unnamed protein product, partial [Rotaria sp. Silwood2]
SISAQSCSYGGLPGKQCGIFPWTFCCPVDTVCGSYEGRTCYTKSNGPGVIEMFIKVFRSN